MKAARGQLVSTRQNGSHRAEGKTLVEARVKVIGAVLTLYATIGRFLRRNEIGEFQAE